MLIPRKSQCTIPSINIIARTNGVGLDQDVDLVREVLENAGFEVNFSHCRDISAWSRLIPCKARYDANIFLERVFPRWLPRAKKNFLIPNQERFPRRQLRHLKKIDAVLCKTRHAFDIFSQYTDSHHIGFTSSDRQLAAVAADYQSCFHLAGHSTLKGTDTILDLWEKHPSWPQLTLVQCRENAPKSAPPNVRLISEYMPKDTLIEEMNRHGIHLCPSLSEGWGHYILEAMSCEALVLTTDGPPMNELVTPETGILVPHHRQESRHLGTNFYADPAALQAALEDCFRFNEADKKLYGERARKRFKTIQTNFDRTFPEVIHPLLSEAN